MNKYKIEYVCADGYEGEEIILAVNRVMAMEVFDDFGYEDVVSINCYRIEEEE